MTVRGWMGHSRRIVVFGGVGVAAIAIGLTLAVVIGLLRPAAEASPTPSPSGSAAASSGLQPSATEMPTAAATPTEAVPTPTETVAPSASPPPGAVVAGMPAAVWGLAAGESGFLAWGGEPYRLWDASRTSFILISTDGVSWAAASVPSEIRLERSTIAWGPRGWLLLGMDTWDPSARGIWRSDDGRVWSSDGPWPLPDDVSPTHLIATDAGYLLLASDSRSGTSQKALFFSAASGSWQEVSGEGAWDREVSTVGRGFLDWEEDWDDGAQIRWSTNGLDWTDTSAGGSLARPLGSFLKIARAGARLVATSVTLQGELRVWVALLPSDLSAPSLALDWRRSTQAEVDLAGVRINALVSDGSRAVAIGWSSQATHPAAWVSADGITWGRSAVNPFDGSHPELVTAGPAGFVALGSDVTLAGANPRFWRSGDGEAWHAATIAGLRRVTSPVVGDCPPLPTSLVELRAVPTAVALACFGDAEISVVAWLTVSAGCGGFYPGTFVPEWLASPWAQAPIILEPVVAEYGGCGDAARHPSVNTLPEPQRWVSVTGHFDDAAASTCRYEPDPLYPDVVMGEDEIVLRCRQVFVATDVHEVDPP